MIENLISNEEMQALAGLTEHPGFSILQEIIGAEEALCREKLLTDDKYLPLWRALNYLLKMAFANPRGMVAAWTEEQKALFAQTNVE